MTSKQLFHPDRLVFDLDIETEEEKEFSLYIRLPWWLQGEPVILVNGEAVDVQTAKSTKDGFVEIRRVWKQDRVHVELPKGIYVDYLPGREDMAAYMDGPVTLAGLCSEECSLYVDRQKPEEALVNDNEREWGYWQNTYKTTGQDRGIRFMPLWQIGYEEYQVYFPLRQK